MTGYYELLPDSPFQSVPDGRGSSYSIGDGVVLTAGHVVYFIDYKSDPLRRTAAQVKISRTNDLTLDIRGYHQALINAYLAHSHDLNKSNEENVARIMAGNPNFQDMVLAKRGGDVTSSDAGIILFLNPFDLSDIAFGLKTTDDDIKVEREGSTTGPFGDARLDFGAGAVFNPKFTFYGENDSRVWTGPGDSGGGIVINFTNNALNLNNRKFLSGNVVKIQASLGGTVSDPRAPAQSTFFTVPDFQKINDKLSETQTGNVTDSEPTNLIVGSANADGSKETPIEGSYRADIILGRGDKDVLNDGDSAGDTVFADDQLFGGAGDDILIVGDGNNLIHGGDFRDYGGGRTAIADDGTDTASFAGSTNGIDIRFPALGPGSTGADTRYQSTLGASDYAASLFVRSRTLTGSATAGFTNTLVSIEKIIGSEASDVLYIGAIPDGTAQARGLTEIDFAGQKNSAYVGGYPSFIGVCAAAF